MTKRQFSFDPERHEYRLDGRIVPGPTKVFSDLGLSDPITPENAEIGHKRHTICEWWDRGEIDEGSLGDLHPWLLGQVTAWRKFLADTDFVVDADWIERPTWSALGYGGIPDRLGLLGNHWAGVEAELPTPKSQQSTATVTPAAQAQAAAEAPANGNGRSQAVEPFEGVFRVDGVSSRRTANGSTWTAVKFSNGRTAGTYHDTPGRIATRAKEEGLDVRVKAIIDDKGYTKIEALEIVAEREPGCDDGDQPQDAKVVA